MRQPEMIKIYLTSTFLVLSFFCYTNSHAQTDTATKAVANVIVATGQTKAISPKNEERKLKRRSPLYIGDKVATGPDGNLQIRFIDDAVLALKPDSTVQINQYAYNKDTPKQNKSFTTLIKGGFRTITGAIAKGDPNDYKVTTPVAVIGVRGTNYTALLRGGELFLSVWKGNLRVSNRSGVLRIGRTNKYSHVLVSTDRSRPEGLVTAPRFIKPRGCP